ncbi:MAG: DEAD/DEAH box helicase [Elusimicrobia bacterium]|nr:DEAD/DEAH box helicase [Elusimicrobiota bacterium]
MPFTEFHFHPSISSGIKAMGYVMPTPIQREAIPHALLGKDVLGLAQTGTGKTAAFALPILERLLAGPKGRVRALVLAPTRELAEQIHVAFKGLGRGTHLRSAPVYGGVKMGGQLTALKGKAEIVVACPGRLLDHVGRRTADLSGVEVLVIDEADRMLDMGFLPDIRRILQKLPAERQTMFFSATMPDTIATLARECLRDPVTVSIDHLVPLTTVAHAVYPVGEHRKAALALELVRRIQGGSILVFTRTKMGAQRLSSRLRSSGETCAEMQGDLSQNERTEALEGFRRGTYRVLVATDIAARGLDISDITHVINYDMPDTVDAYTHRIGRTGRVAKTGDAFTLVTGKDEAMIREIERFMGRLIERRKIDGFDYGATIDAHERPRRAQATAPAPAVLPPKSSGWSQRRWRFKR